jgi:hypothetical protein
MLYHAEKLSYRSKPRTVPCSAVLAYDAGDLATTQLSYVEVDKCACMAFCDWVSEWRGFQSRVSWRKREKFYLIWRVIPTCK